MRFTLVSAEKPSTKRQIQVPADIVTFKKGGIGRTKKLLILKNAHKKRATRVKKTLGCKKSSINKKKKKKKIQNAKPVIARKR